MIRQATKNDVSRIAEILVFSKRMNYRAIFQNDAYSFGELQVDTVAKQYDDDEILSHTWVYTETLSDWNVTKTNTTHKESRRNAWTDQSQHYLC